MAKKSYNYAQLEGLAQEMRSKSDMVYFYEYQVPTATLPTGEVLDLVKEFGNVRTSGRGWPIDEHWIAGAAIGAACAGSHAVARIPTMAPIYVIEYVQNQAGKIRSMTGGQASMPFVLWQEGAGRNRGNAGQHTDVGQEALYAQLPGLKVVAPSDAYDAKGLLIAAIRDPDPVVYLDYGEVKAGEVVFCCGPDPMMHAVAALCEKRGLRCFLSLETYMACGYGVCNGCSVAVQGERFKGWPYSKTCQEGPVYEACELAGAPHH